MIRSKGSRILADVNCRVSHTNNVMSDACWALRTRGLVEMNSAGQLLPDSRLRWHEMLLWPGHCWGAAAQAAAIQGVAAWVAVQGGAVQGAAVQGAAAQVATAGSNGITAAAAGIVVAEDYVLHHPAPAAAGASESCGYDSSRLRLRLQHGPSKGAPVRSQPRQQ